MGGGDRGREKERESSRGSAVFSQTHASNNISMTGDEGKYLDYRKDRMRLL